MKQRFQRILNNITRFITNEETQFRIYLYWAIAAVLVIGFFGIYPFTKSLINKIQVFSSMTSVNNNLSTKTKDLSIAETKLAEAGGDVLFIDNYLPETFNIQNYMVDFVVAVADGGFTVDTFTPVKQAGNAYELAIAMSGNGDIIKIIKNLEALNRVSEVESLRLYRNTEGINLNLLVKTFIMEKQ